MKKGSVRVKNGNINLSIRTKGAKELLKSIGAMFAKKLSRYLGGAEVQPMVQECRHSKGTWRLMFSIPKGVDTKMLDIHEFAAGVRIWGVPVNLFADNGVQEFLASMSSHQGTARFNERGDISVRMTFDGHDEMVRCFKKAQELGLIAKHLQKPRRGSASVGFNIIVPVLSKRNVKDSQPQEEVLTAQSLYELCWKVLITLPKSYQDRLISSAMDLVNEEGRLKIISSVLPDGVGLYDTNTPFKQNGVGMVVNKIVLEEEV